MRFYRSVLLVAFLLLNCVLCIAWDNYLWVLLLASLLLNCVLYSAWDIERDRNKEMEKWGR